MDFCRDKVRNQKARPRLDFRTGRFFTSLRKYLLADRPKVSTRTVILALLGILLGGMLTGQVIWQHVSHTRARLEVNTLEQRHHELKMKIQRLQIAVSRLEQLDRIQRIAVKQLGMKPQGETSVLKLSKTQWAQSSRERDPPMVP